jgi:hypothetical protein
MLNKKSILDESYTKCYHLYIQDLEIRGVRSDVFELVLFISIFFMDDYYKGFHRREILLNLLKSR